MADKKENGSGSTPAPPPVRLGVIGLGGYARKTVDALEQMDRGDVVVAAVADLNKELAERTAERFDARAFVDARSLIVESQLDALLMSLPHHVYPDFVPLAAERGLHLLKEKPLGRSFEEALAMVDLYDRAKAVFMIGTQRRFHPAFVAVRDRLEKIGRPFLVRSHFLFNLGGEWAWRGERHKAGFGVMGHAGWHNFDLINGLFGPPGEVYGRQAGVGRADPVHPYDTDDTGLCMLRWGGGLMGYVACSRAAGWPVQLDLIVHGTAGSLAGSFRDWRLLDSAGEVVEQGRVDQKKVNQKIELARLAAFLAAIRNKGQGGYPCSARENLVTQAVVESAYLSGRTGQPQEPSRIFELHGRRLADYLPSHQGAS